MSKETAPSLKKGIAVIKQQLTTMPKSPGVYRMLDQEGNVLYVGKAKNLLKRVSNYASASGLTARIMKMVSLTASMEIITTRNEAEALLMEASLIKSLKPRYNILLRDDKSFPFIHLSDHDYPRISKYRGKRKKDGHYFGPFASAGDVNRTIDHLQKLFRLRPCTDTMFESRKRPCLEYQIKRCSGPCVEKVSTEEYQQQIGLAMDFLSGKSKQVQTHLISQMEEASTAMEYEKAAFYRDQVHALTHIQNQQKLAPTSIKDADIIGLHQEGGACCIQIFFFRAGQNYGNRAYFPAHTAERSEQEIIEAFIGQFYQKHYPPKEIYISHESNNRTTISQALSELSDTKVTLHTPKQGEKRTLVETAIDNAKKALASHLAENSRFETLHQEVQTIFDLPRFPKRIEVYDNSHIMGKHAIGAMIVASDKGFDKSEYRKFTIKSKLTPGDDYAMMREVLRRRLTKLKTDYPSYTENKWPDLLLIDGGKGQLSSVKQILNELDLSDIPCIAIAKGIKRNAGNEQFFMEGRAPFRLDRNNPVLYYLQTLRDESHRYVIGSHRNQRGKTITTSSLDDIAGIGPKRKKQLLQHFGSIRAIENATMDDLQKLESINSKTAQLIYDHFHGE